TWFRPGTATEEIGQGTLHGGCSTLIGLASAKIRIWPRETPRRYQTGLPSLDLSWLTPLRSCDRIGCICWGLLASSLGKIPKASNGSSEWSTSTQCIRGPKLHCSWTGAANFRGHGPIPDKKRISSKRQLTVPGPRN